MPYFNLTTPYNNNTLVREIWVIDESDKKYWNLTANFTDDGNNSTIEEGNGLIVLPDIDEEPVEDDDEEPVEEDKTFLKVNYEGLEDQKYELDLSVNDGESMDGTDS